MTPLEMKLTNDLVAVRKITNENPTTASGIILPPVEESSDTPWRGVVLATGPGKPAKLSGAGQEVLTALQKLVSAFHAAPGVTEGPRGVNLAHWQRAEDALKEHEGTCARIPMQVQVGDTIIFSQHGHQVFKIDGHPVYVMGEASVMGVLEAA